MRVGHRVAACSCTWVELADMFQIQSNYRFVDSFDIADHAAIMRVAFKRAVEALGIWRGNKQISVDRFFNPSSNIVSISSLTGLRLPGIQRRPIFDRSPIVQLATCIRAIFAATPTRAGFGKKIKWHCRKGHAPQLSTSEVSTGNATQARSGPCARGHLYTGNAEGGLPYWPVMPTPSPWTDVPAGAVLCFACYQRAGIAAKRLARRSKPPPANDAPT